MDDHPLHHDIIVIGASSGGLDALSILVRHLPADLPAAIFIVLHVGRSSHLADILNKRAALPVAEAISGEPIEKGRIFVAAPGAHLLLHDHHVLVRRGPRENMARPAIDPLFRSAAATFGGRVIGVVLSGALNDGTAGLQAIKECGGLTVAQDPLDAIISDMPASAIRQVGVDYISPISEIGPLLTSLVHEPAGRTPVVPLNIRLEAAIAAQELEGMKAEDMLGTPSRFTCPECHGALWEIEDGGILRYRCHVGHAYTAETMLSGRSDEIDGLLAALLRSHNERAALTRRMAEQELNGQRPRLARQLETRATEYEHDAKVIRRLLMADGDSQPDADAPQGALPPHGQERL